MAKNVLISGATGDTGRAAVREAIDLGLAGQDPGDRPARNGGELPRHQRSDRPGETAYAAVNRAAAGQ